MLLLLNMAREFPLLPLLLLLVQFFAADAAVHARRMGVPNCTAHTFPQNVDHFGYDPAAGTYEQRYFVYDGFVFAFISVAANDRCASPDAQDSGRPRGSTHKLGVRNRQQMDRVRCTCRGVRRLERRRRRAWSADAHAPS